MSGKGFYCAGAAVGAVASHLLWGVWLVVDFCSFTKQSIFLDTYSYFQVKGQRVLSAGLDETNMLVSDIPSMMAQIVYFYYFLF